MSSASSRDQPMPFDYLVVGLGWLAAVLAVGPGGEFPLGDDWAYAWTAEQLCQFGELDLLPWAAPSLLAHVGWGALACLVAGPSFVALRLTTLGFAGAGILAFHFLLARCGADRKAALIATMTLAFSPLYFGLSFTFMTDVPCVALIVAAAVFYVRGLEDGDPSDLSKGAAILAIAVLVRQNALFLAGAAALTAWRYPLPRTERWAAITRCLAAPLVTAALYYGWLLLVHGAPAGASIRLAAAGSAGPLRVVDVAFRSWLTLGLLVAPVVALGAVRRERFVHIVLPLTGLLAVVAGLAASKSGAGFALPNLLHPLGVGAITLRDVLFLDLASPFDGPLALRVAISVASVLTAGLVASRFPTRTEMNSPARCFALSAFVLALAGSFLQADFYFDRYLLPALPFLLVVLATGGPTKRYVGATAILVAMTAYSIGGTHDYMAWNRARHALLQELEDRGVPPTQIDGGVEFNGWHLAPGKRTWPSIDEATPGRPASEKSWWWVTEDRWIVSFQPLAGYRVAETRPWPRWLPPGTGQTLLLREAPDLPKDY